MEPPSASPHRGHVPWQGLLLAVLVSPLTFWNLPTTAQLAIESVPFTAAEGTDVLLLAHNVSENVKGYTWYKGERGIDSHQISIYLTATQGIIPGPAYSGRETVYPNGSLLFQKVTLEDTGFYTLQTISSDLQAEKASGHISSGTAPQISVPYLTNTCGPSGPDFHRFILLCLKTFPYISGKIHKVLTCPPLLRAICGLNRHGRPLSRKIWYLGTSRGNPAGKITQIYVSPVHFCQVPHSTRDGYTCCSHTASQRWM
uniref:Carcinoembryonic antigen-related cell adhesion molecule 6-like n=1 Tax=Marmota marmota marmota TaxID=9994 RepID=A0A8C6EV91_MARMA